MVARTSHESIKVELECSINSLLVVDDVAVMDAVTELTVETNCGKSVVEAFDVIKPMVKPAANAIDTNAIAHILVIRHEIEHRCLANVRYYRLTVFLLRFSFSRRAVSGMKSTAGHMELV